MLHNMGPIKQTNQKKAGGCLSSTNTYVLPFIIDLLHAVAVPLQLFVSLLPPSLDVHLDVAG